MGLFGGKKKTWDLARSDANKARMRELFNASVPDGASYKLAYGYGLNIKSSDFIVARKTTYQYISLIVGYRASDQSIVLIQTVPDLDGCSGPEIFKKDQIKKAKMATGMYTIYHAGGLMAGYTQFDVIDTCDERYLAYVYQPDEAADFKAFFKSFSER